MIFPSNRVRVLVATQPVDFRKRLEFGIEAGQRVIHDLPDLAQR